MLGRPRFGAWRTAVPQVEGHRRLFRIFAEISQGLAVQRVVSSEQHTGSTEFRGYVGPRAVLARPMTHTALQGFIRVSCKHAIRFEPSASLRELRVHRSHAVLVVAPRDEVPEGPGHAYGRPGSAVFPSLLLLSERFRLTFNEQQVIKQGPKSRLTPVHPRSTERQVQLVDKVVAYLFRGRKQAGRDHLHSFPHRGQAGDPEYRWFE